MDSHIEACLLQLTSITQDLPGVARGLSSEQFNWRPSPGQWSIGQCVEHLNITTERYLPVLRSAIAEARASGKLSHWPLALGLLERAFLRMLEPPVRMRAKAPKAFVATEALSPAETLSRWDRLNVELGECLRLAEGLDHRRVRVRSQFGPMSFSLAATFLILLAHDRRHIWQARQVRNAGSFPRE